jgi:hypothetical protein
VSSPASQPQAGSTRSWRADARWGYEGCARTLRALYGGFRASANGVAVFRQLTASAVAKGSAVNATFDNPFGDSPLNASLHIVIRSADDPSVVAGALAALLYDWEMSLDFSPWLLSVMQIAAAVLSVIFALPAVGVAGKAVWARTAAAAAAAAAAGGALRLGTSAVGYRAHVSVGESETDNAATHPAASPLSARAQALV